MKKRIKSADALVDEIVRKYRIAEYDFDVSLHKDWELYITIE